VDAAVVDEEEAVLVLRQPFGEARHAWKVTARPLPRSPQLAAAASSADRFWVISRKESCPRTIRMNPSPTCCAVWQIQRTLAKASPADSATSTGRNSFRPITTASWKGPKLPGAEGIITPATRQPITT